MKTKKINTDPNAEMVARQIAQEYWRGRIESATHSAFEQGVLENMIESAGRSDFRRYMGTARQLLERLTTP
jgi:hypothetical protein